MIITVDGPTASGKGSLARAIAQKRGYFYVDTGSLYRAIGYAISQSYDKQAVKAGRFWTAEFVKKLADQITYSYENGAAKVFFSGQDVTIHLRTPLIDWYASHVSREPLVRQGLREMQQKMGSEHDIVVDGRDCGTVIFPQAEHKFYLTAHLDTRVQRALDDACRKAHDVAYDVMKSEILQRDLRDLTRPVSPLVPAFDAVIIDSTYLDPAQTLALVLQKL